tara:strand:- start:333 stop:575 length:243 start_codon:yes stop_codon:yes gene_type:complete
LRGKREWLERGAEIGRRFEVINDMLDQRNTHQMGLGFPRKADEMHWGLYGSGASNHGLDTIMHVGVIPSVPDKFIMFSTV